MLHGCEEGIAALNRGEYRRAVELLERAAAENDFASDLINHAYTLALFRANEKSRLADIAFRIALNAVAEDPASALDYFQRAVQAGLDAAQLRRLGEIHESWAGEWERVKLSGDVTRVGHVVSSLVPDHPQTSYVRIVVESLKLLGVHSTIFTTECGAAWFSN